MVYIAFTVGVVEDQFSNCRRIKLQSSHSVCFYVFSNVLHFDNISCHLFSNEPCLDASVDLKPLCEKQDLP